MQVKCPGCQKMLQIPEAAAGKRVKCPMCNQLLTAIAPKETLRIPLENGPGAKMPSENVSAAKTPDLEIPRLLELIASYKKDMEKSLKERDEGMEMVDTFFNLFMERSTNPNLDYRSQQEYKDTAQKLFELQKKFPLLSGTLDILTQCEKMFRNISSKSSV